MSSGRLLPATALVAYVLAWPLATLAAAWAWSRGVGPALVAALLVCQHVNAQLGFFYHELWHNQFFRTPGPNRLFYYLISVFLFSNPQIYGAAHRSHHQAIHSFEDLEFWPRGRPASAWSARLQTLAELCFGQVAWTLAVAPRLHRSPDHRNLVSVLFALAFLTKQLAMAWATERLTGSWTWFPLAYGVNLWVFSVSARWLQFSEHLGILAPELELEARNRLTRHVAREGWLDLAWHALTVNDSGNHMDHHLWPRQPNRGLVAGLAAAPSDAGTVVPAAALPGIVWRALLDPLAITPAREPAPLP